MAYKNNALLKQRTWTLVPHNPKENIIDCRWIYNIKHRFEGSSKPDMLLKGFNNNMKFIFMTPLA